MSADLLRRAADRVEQLTAEALGGTWEFHLDHHPEPDPSVWRNSPVDGGGMYVVETFHGNPRGVEHARWIAALGPQVGLPLAAWLRAEADDLERNWVGAEDDWPPMQLACVLLGEDVS